MSSLDYLNVTQIFPGSPQCTKIVAPFKSYICSFNYSIHKNLILCILSYIISKHYVPILSSQHTEHFLRAELISFKSVGPTSL